MAYRSRLLLTVALCALATVFWLFSGAPDKSRSVVRNAPQVMSQAVTFSDISPQMRLYATVENAGNTNLHTQVAGTIESVLVRPSVDVKQGDKLVCIDSTKYQLEHQIKVHECDEVKAEVKLTEEEIAQSQKYVDLSQKSLELSESKYQRIENLSNQNEVSPQAFEDAKSQWVKAQIDHEKRVENDNKLKIKRSKAQSNLAKCQTAITRSTKVLDDFCIKAPLDGKIVNTLVAPGAVVSAGQSLITFSPDQGLELHAMVLSSQLEKLGRGVIGAKLWANHELSPIDYLGVVDSQGKSTRGFEAIFKANNQKLYPGQTHEIVVSLKPIQDAVLIDPEIVFDDQYVYSLVPQNNGEMMLKKHTIDCYGYQLNGNKRMLVCQISDAKGVTQLLVTRLPSAMSGLRVKTSA